MKRALPVFIFTAACLILYACTTTMSTTTHGIPNLNEMAVGVYRGGSPTPEGLRWLRSQGVTNWVKLSTEEQYPKKPAEDAGIKVFEFPIDTDDQIFGNPENALGAAQKLAQLGRGTFLGCQHGQDRTGLVAAMYRVLHDGWPKQNAEAEMLSLGFHKDLWGLWQYWQRFNPNRKMQR